MVGSGGGVQLTGYLSLLLLKPSAFATFAMLLKCYTANYTSSLIVTDCTFSEMSNDIRNHHDEDCGIVFWRDDDIQTLVRAPLS